MKKHRSLVLRFLILAALPFGLAVISWVLPGFAAQKTPAAANAANAKYLGPGSCSAVACHGGIMPSSATSVLQNEYSTWVVKDKHARAFRVLGNPVSARMTRILGVGRPESAPKCLACHALSVAADRKGRDFEVSEGVSCENCHGPSSGWLGDHSIKGSTRPKSVALGMFDSSDLIQRSEKCLSCHLGTAEKSVDHEMIAAGHPDLVFELDAYSAAMPAHWKPSPDPGFGLRTWGVGQAVQLRESLRRLSRRAQGTVWPEYAELDCFSCHHNLVRADESWRQARGYEDRRPGNPPWNMAHFSVFRVLAKEVDRAAGAELEKGLEGVYRQASRLDADRAQVAAAAGGAAETAHRLALQLNGMVMDRARARRLMRAITAEADSIAGHGPRSAEQAAMALDSLFITYSQNSREDPDTRAAIKGLFQQLENPSGYSAPRFAAQMRKVAAALR